MGLLMLGCGYVCGPHFTGGFYFIFILLFCFCFWIG